MSDSAARTRAVWSAGDYPQIAVRFEQVAEALVESADVKGGQRLLDVATGTGNVALAAARRRAVVTASDITPRMLELGRARAAAADLNLEWVEADMLDLPFDAGAFDTVASCFGVIFAPDPEAAAGELARVLRGGGRLALACWCPDPSRDRRDAPLRRRLKPDPTAPDPMDWGRPDIVTQRLSVGFSDLTITQQPFTWAFDDANAAVDFFLTASPLHAATVAALPNEERSAVRAEMIAGLAEDAGPDGHVAYDIPWLLITATRRSP